MQKATSNKPTYPVNMEDAYVSSPYDWRLDPFTNEMRFHYAVDFASYGGLNIPIYATQTGIVLESDNLEDHRGQFIYLEHLDDSYFSSYYHMSERYVSVGNTVVKGDIIGLMGTTGASTGVHLDFRIYTKYPAYSNELEWATIDPLVYLAEGGDPGDPGDPVDPEQLPYFITNRHSTNMRRRGRR